jgi:hypothetical protein
MIFYELHKIRVEKGIIPDQIFYPHPHFLLKPTQKEDKNPRKSHPFYNPA